MAQIRTETDLGSIIFSSEWLYANQTRKSNLGQNKGICNRRQLISFAGCDTTEPTMTSSIKKRARIVPPPTLNNQSKKGKV